MIKLKRAVVVEGKYDKIKLNAVLDAVIIKTDGFGVFKDKEKQKLIRKLAETTGIVILTDSDSAGFVIRNFIKSIAPNGDIINAYIPDIFGKEKRKTQSSKEGKLGVEGIPVDILKTALEKAGVFCEKTEDTEKRKITKTDLFEDGFSGTQNSKDKRKALLKQLDLPEKLTTNALLDILNSLMTYDEYKIITESL